MSATDTFDTRPFLPVIDVIGDDPFGIDTDPAIQKALEDDPFGDVPIPPAKNTRVTRPYHPGTPGLIKPLGQGRYAVESWKKRGTFYTVDLFSGSCDCPSRKPCKHIRQARVAAYEKAYRTAMPLTEEELVEHVRRVDLRPEIHTAVADVLSRKYW